MPNLGRKQQAYEMPMLGQRSYLDPFLHDTWGVWYTTHVVAYGIAYAIPYGKLYRRPYGAAHWSIGSGVLSRPLLKTI